MDQLRREGMKICSPNVDPVLQCRSEDSETVNVDGCMHNTSKETEHVTLENYSFDGSDQFYPDK